MSRNEVFKDADYVSLPVPVGTKSGDPVRVGGINAKAETDEPTAYLATLTGDYNMDPSSDEPGWASCKLNGAHTFPIATAAALTIGAPVYIIVATNALTTTDNSGANPLFGYTLSVKAAVANAKAIVRISN